MRPLSAALTLILFGSLAGCDEKSSDSTRSGGYGTLVADDAPRREPEASPVSLDSKSASDLRDAVLSAPTTPGAEALAQSQRATFDGDGRRLGGLGDSGEGEEGVPAWAGPWGSAKQKVALSPSKNKTLKTGEVPPPDSLSKVDMPQPKPGAGSQGGGPMLLAFDAFQHKVYKTFSPLLSRLGWGAAERRGEPEPHEPFRVTVHHTDGHQTMDEKSTIEAVRGVQYYHMAGRAQAGKDVWDDIGYHFLIDGQGRIVEGRPPEVMGAHAKGYNEGNIGVALMGDFNKQKPTAAQVQSLERLVSFLAIKYQRDRSDKGFLEPHRHFNSTDCPGKNVMVLLDRIRREVDHQTETVANNLKPDSTFTPLYASVPL